MLEEYEAQTSLDSGILALNRALASLEALPAHPLPLGFGS